jgi:hypothetical protein
VTAPIAKTPLGDPLLSFDVDFRPIPFRGAEANLDNTCVLRWNRAVPSERSFVAQALGGRVLCYAPANLLRDEANGTAHKFADSRKEQT